LLARLVRRGWPAGTKLGALGLVLRCDDLPSMEARLRWVEELLDAVPADRQPAALDLLDGLLERRWSDEERRQRSRTALAMLGRLDAGCPRPTCCAVDIVADLAEAAGRGHVEPRLLGAPDGSLERLRRDSRNHNRGSLLHQGLEAMAGRLGSLVIDAFVAHPEALFHTARLLGGLDEARRVVLVKRFRSHPLMRRRLLNSPVAELADAIRRHADDRLPNPVPRKLRDHLAGAMTLGSAAVDRHRQTLVRRLPPLKLALLRRMVLDDLAKGLPAIDTADANERHALQMLGAVRRNRRLLRRVLRVPPDARRAFLLDHPANQAWLRKHPRLSADLWARGFERSFEHQGRSIRLAIEPDPMKVLRLGTEVGSCLSVGGGCAFSAVAVMADVNKQVVFARDAAGTFVARQVVAIAEDDRVVFFPVYPASATEAVKAAFFQYDVGLASALGLEPYRSDHGEPYSIALVLAGEFYDDGPWDRFGAPRG
jgi:hypothetical protein